MNEPAFSKEACSAIRRRLVERATPQSPFILFTGDAGLELIAKATAVDVDVLKAAGEEIEPGLWLFNDPATR